MNASRRRFLLKVGMAGAGIAAASQVALGQAAATQQAVEPLPPTEDLMREHGLIHRLLTVYEDAADRLAEGQPVPSEVLLGGGVLVDEFVESYHEELEEQHIFPLFDRAGRMADLVGVLRRQHAMGRALEAEIIFLAGKGDLLAEGTREPLVEACRSYARMYRAHAAHEDTVLFVAVRELIPPEEFARLGEQFHAFEEEQLGEGGFGGALQSLTELEAMLGIEELDSFTAQP